MEWFFYNKRKGGRDQVEIQKELKRVKSPDSDPTKKNSYK